MLRYKQFSGPPGQLEEAINRWLSAFEPDVTQMVQTVAQNGNVVISFLFEESFRGQELRYSAEHGMTGAQAPAVPLDTIPDEPIQVPGDTAPLSGERP